MPPLDDTPAPPLSQCDPWGGPHFLLQASHLCLAGAFLLPTVRSPAAYLASRVLLVLGFLGAGAWAAFKSCAGPDVVAWNAALLLANFAQAAWLVYRRLPPRIRPELQDLYTRLFAPLKVGKEPYRQLVKHAHLESLDAGEHYATEGVTDTDQRLAILLSGRMVVTCEDTLLHYLLPTEFVDSPEWESCASNTDKRFQVTLTATEPCQLLCWGRKELLSLLSGNPFLDVVMYNLIGRDITHKLYSLNERHQRGGSGGGGEGSPVDFWRNPLIPRAQSVDMVHTGNTGHVRSLFWRKPERKAATRRTSVLIAEHLGDSRTSNFSDPGPRRNKNIKSSPDESRYETPV